MADVPKIEGERAEEKLHFLDYWRVIKKRKEIIIAILVISVFATFVFSTIAKDTYSAYSLIKITQWQRPMDPFTREPARFLPFDQHEFETHLRLMQSDPVLERVVKGEIYSDRHFWQCPRHPQVRLDDARAEGQAYACALCGSPLVKVREKKYPNWERLDVKWAARNNYPGGRYPMQAAISILRGSLKIRPEKGTRLISIRCESHDKEEARLIADMVAEAYVQLMAERRDKKLQGAIGVLREQTRIYRYGGPAQGHGLKAEEAEMMRMRSQFTLDKQDQLVQYQKLADFTQRRNDAKVQIAQLKSEIEKLTGMTKDQRVNATQENAAIYQLAVELGREEARLKYYLADYGEEHPEIKGQKDRIQAIKQNLYNLADGVLDSKRAEMAKQEAYERELEKIIKGLNEEINKSQQAYFDYLIKKSDVEMKRLILQKVEERQIEEGITNAIPSEDIQLVQRAQSPQAPVRPKPVFNVIVSVFVGLTLGTGVAYFVEYLDTSMKTVDDVERYLNVSTLAVIPQQKEGLLIHQSPKSHAAENYRMLWTNIEFARKEDKFRNVMITSGGAAEGKTTTVVNLGIAAAQMGARVLLVDSDLRRPKIHKLLRYSNRVGLSDVLLKDVGPRDVLLSTEVPGLWVMPSGKLPSNVIGLLNSQKMRDVISTLSQDFDVLLYDSPPVMGVSDASVMAGVVERVLMVIDYRKYPKRLAMRAKRNLENVGGRILGAVINNLNVLKEDYYYYGYGYGKAYHYYYSRPEEEEEEPEEKVPAEASEGTKGARAPSDPGPEGTGEEA